MGGAEGVASHSGSDGATSWERQTRYGQWLGASGECLWYGRLGSWVDAKSIIDDLVVDDGVPSRGHRLAVFDERYNMAGVATGDHKAYGNMVAIELAGSYTEEQNAIKERLRAGAPKLQKVVMHGRGRGGHSGSLA